MENHATLFVQSFDICVTAAQLYGLFQEASQRKSVISAQVYRNSVQHNRVAILKFGDPRDAHECSMMLNAFPVDISQIKISDCFPQELSHYNNWELEQHMSDPNSATIQTTVMDVQVANLSLSTIEESLRSVFGRYGIVLEASVIRDGTGTSLGYGFVKFQSTESALAAVRALNGQVFDGKIWRVQKGYKKSQRHKEIGEAMSKGLVLYVENLHYGVKETHLEQLFSEFGEVVSCRIRRNQDTGVSKGDAFVEFATKEERIRAMSMDGKTLWGRRIYLGAGKSKV